MESDQKVMRYNTSKYDNISNNNLSVFLHICVPLLASRIGRHRCLFDQLLDTISICNFLKEALINFSACGDADGNSCHRPLRVSLSRNVPKLSLFQLFYDGAGNK